MRNLFLLSALVASSALSFNTLAAKLTIPDIFSVQKIDGVDYNSGIFFDETVLDLDQGDHVLELKYTELFENEDDEDHVFIKSDPFVITFNITSDENLLLSRPIFSDGDSSARVYAEDPTVKITSMSRQKTEVTSVQPTDKSTKKTSAVAITSASTITAVTPVTVSTPKAEPSQAIKDVTNIADTNVSLEKLAMLKYWWQQASAQEKEAFKAFINKY